MSFASRTTGSFFRILMSLLGLTLVFYVLIEFRLWSTEWTNYFVKVGKWEEIIFISLIIAAITTVVLKLYGWHLRKQGGR